MGRISGDFYAWAQNELVDVAKTARSESVAMKAFGKIGLEKPDVFVDIAKNAGNLHVALAAFDKISPDNQDGLVDVARYSRHDDVIKKAFDKITEKTLDKHPSLRDYKRLKYESGSQKRYKLDKVLR